MVTTECACIYSEYDIDSAVCLGTDTRRARKTHTCDECGREIATGEEYERAFGVDGTLTWTHKTCRSCLEVREAFFCQWSYGGLWEDLWEWLFSGEITWDILWRMDGLSAEPRGRVLGMIQDIWDEEDER